MSDEIIARNSRKQVRRCRYFTADVHVSPSGKCLAGVKAKSLYKQNYKEKIDKNRKDQFVPMSWGKRIPCIKREGQQPLFYCDKYKEVKYAKTNCNCGPNDLCWCSPS